jgi:hypothetical protein
MFSDARLLTEYLFLFNLFGVQNYGALEKFVDLFVVEGFRERMFL